MNKASNCCGQEPRCSTFDVAPSQAVRLKSARPPALYSSPHTFPYIRRDKVGVYQEEPWYLRMGLIPETYKNVKPVKLENSKGGALCFMLYFNNKCQKNSGQRDF